MSRKLVPCFVCVLLLQSFSLQQRKWVPLPAAAYLLSALPINMTGNTFNKFLLFPMEAEEMFVIFWNKRGLKVFLITLNFLKPELHHEEHLLKSGLRDGDNSVCFFQLTSHVSKTAEEGSITNTEKEDDKCRHFTAATVSERVKINWSLERAEKSRWL